MRRRSDKSLKSLHSLRSMRVLIVHPDDRDRHDLVAQINRIGCISDAMWPPSEHIASDIDIVFFLFSQDLMTNAFINALNSCNPRPALIGIVESESPRYIETVVHAGTLAVIAKPVRSSGLLTSMVLAHVINARNRLATERMTKLQQRIAGIKQFEQAKAILATRLGFDEKQAYEWLRARAMSKRISLDSVCLGVIEAVNIFD